MRPIVEAKGVSKTFTSGLLKKRRTNAVEDVSLAIGGPEPTVIAIAGESGSGKTTLAQLLLNLQQPTEGVVEFMGRDLATLSRRERKSFRRQVQAIFQDPFEVYNPFYKVDSVLHGPAKKFQIGRSMAERNRLIEESLNLVGLLPEETLGRYPHQLSGGQRQRVMVARAMLIRPQLIIADEPVSMVDASLRATILESLLKLNKELGISLVYITHDLTTAFQISDSIMIMYQGSIVEVGDVSKVIKDPQHPYTKLLVSSIPLPDPHKDWGTPQVRQENAGIVSAGCKFAPRCPVVMNRCSDALPPLYSSAPGRASACFLFDEHPALDRVELAGLFAPGPSARENGSEPSGIRG